MPKAGGASRACAGPGAVLVPKAGAEAYGGRFRPLAPEHGRPCQPPRVAPWRALAVAAVTVRASGSVGGRVRPPPGPARGPGPAPAQLGAFRWRAPCGGWSAVLGAGSPASSPSAAKVRAVLSTLE